MGFLQLAKKRYACRSYEDRQVKKEDLDYILEAGRVAPTGKNAQPQRLLAVQSREGLDKVALGANAYGAPTVLIVCADRESVWVRPYDDKYITDIDATIVTDHMMLAAAERGVDSVWICKFDPAVIRREFEIPETWDIVNLLALGYRSAPPKSPDRHETDRAPVESYTRFC